MPPIELQRVTHQTLTGIVYQHLHIHIATLDGLIEPTDLKGLHLPENIVWNQGIVIEGRAPVWLYGYLIHACHPAAWIACFDPRFGDDSPQSGGAIIIATHTRQVAVGEVLLLHLPESAFRRRDA